VEPVTLQVGWAPPAVDNGTLPWRRSGAAWWATSRHGLSARLYPTNYPEGGQSL